MSHETDPAREQIEPEAPSLSDALAAAVRNSGLGHVTPGEAPTAHALLAAIGGLRGLVESILPPLLFLVVFTVTNDVVPSVLVPLAVALVFVVTRLVMRQPVMSAIVGALGVGISAVLALLTGRASESFVPGLIINVVLLVAVLLSLAVRRPLIGVLVAALTGDTDWRGDAAKLRVSYIATVLWAVLPTLRLAIEVPLYLADETQALGAARLVLGVPPYAIVLWLTWLLMRSAWTGVASASEGRDA